jgi:hypothetical protein
LLLVMNFKFSGNASTSFSFDPAFESVQSLPA